MSHGCLWRRKMSSEAWNGGEVEPRRKGPARLDAGGNMGNGSRVDGRRCPTCRPRRLHFTFRDCSNLLWCTLVTLVFSPRAGKMDSIVPPMVLSLSRSKTWPCVRCSSLVKTTPNFVLSPASHPIPTPHIQTAYQIVSLNTSTASNIEAYCACHDEYAFNASN
jgi:hypothetical protein